MQGRRPVTELGGDSWELPPQGQSTRLLKLQAGHLTLA